VPLPERRRYYYYDAEQREDSKGFNVEKKGSELLETAKMKRAWADPELPVGAGCEKEGKGKGGLTTTTIDERGCSRGCS
jgi:hypothetical protein